MLIAKSGEMGLFVMGISSEWFLSHSMASSALYTMMAALSSFLKKTGCCISLMGMREIGHESLIHFIGR